MLQYENGISGITFDPFATIRAFAIATIPDERRDGKKRFQALTENFFKNLDALVLDSNLSEVEIRDLQGAGYLLCSAYLASGTRTDFDLERFLDLFARTVPEWESRVANIRDLLAVGLSSSTQAEPKKTASESENIFRDAATSLHAAEDSEDPLILFRQGPGDPSWLASEIARLKTSKFRTLAGEIRFGKQLEKNIKSLEDLRARVDGSRTSRSYQKMTLSIYRSVSRNMIDMLTLADRKAGLLLNANAISLTVLVSFFGKGNVGAHPRLWLSSMVIAATCALTVIFASLAARPLRRTRERVSLDQFFAQGYSLLHYGDVAKLSREDFIAGYKVASNDSELLERNMLSELHFFSTRIIDKFRMVRRAYLTMIAGIVLSCIALLLSHYV